MDKEVADLQNQLEKIANEARRDDRDAARKLDEAAGSITDKRIREKIRYTRNTLQGNSNEYARAMEGDIGANLEGLQKKIADAAARSARPSKQDARERALDRDARSGPRAWSRSISGCATVPSKGSAARKVSRDSRGNKVSRANRGSARPAGAAGPAGRPARSAGSERPAGPAGPGWPAGSARSGWPEGSGRRRSARAALRSARRRVAAVATAATTRNWNGGGGLLLA